MQRYDFRVSVTFAHRIVFTKGAFAEGNHALVDVLNEGGGRRVLAVVEDALVAAHPGLLADVERYGLSLPQEWCGAKIFPGGEAAKKDLEIVHRVHELLHEEKIDRHSYLLAIGGGAFLDVIGFAAATAHRGVRLVRFPTTTLAQDDSGVGVKNGVNGFGKKNWVGSFAVPFAVINDFAFLDTLDADTRRAGLIEAVKVGLVKEREFFEWIEEHAQALTELEEDALHTCIERSAVLHAQHIANGGDPFEMGSSRPLDFGHWAAHKLEQLSDFSLTHAHAVAIGVALDTLYSQRIGWLSQQDAERILNVIETLRLPLWHEAFDKKDEQGRRLVFYGLEEFREHLGGELTVLLLHAPGHSANVHEMDEAILSECIEVLHQRWRALAESAS